MILFTLQASEIDPGNDTEQYLHPEKLEDPKKKKSIIKTRKKFERGDVEISLGALVQPEMKLAHQDYEDPKKAGFKPHFNISNSNLYFQGKYLDNCGWEAGYTIRFAPYVGKFEVDRNYAEFKHKNLGTLQFGNQKGVHDLFGKLAQKNMATVWIDGGMSGSLSEPTYVFAGNDLIGQTGNATKFNWISPSIKGFRFAATYTPSTKSVGKNDRNDISYELNDLRTGNAKTWDDKIQPFGNHHLTLMGVYDKTCGNFEFTAAGAVLLDKTHFDSETDLVKNTCSWMGSTQITYKDVSWALEFLHSGKSRLPVEGDVIAIATIDHIFQKGDSGKAINTSLSWEINKKHSVSAGYQYTWRHFGEDGKATKNLFSLGYAFKIFECVSWYTEADYVRYNTAETAQSTVSNAFANDYKNNKGFLLLTGLRVEI